MNSHAHANVWKIDVDAVTQKAGILKKKLKLNLNVLLIFFQFGIQKFVIVSAQTKSNVHLIWFLTKVTAHAFVKIMNTAMLHLCGILRPAVVNVQKSNVLNNLCSIIQRADVNAIRNYKRVVT